MRPSGEAISQGESGAAGERENLVVVLVERHQLLRECLSSRLSQYPGMEIMAVGSLEDVRTSKTGDLRPDLILLSVANGEQLPLGTEFEEFGSVPVVILACDRSPSEVRQLLNSGFRGVITPSIGTEVAIQALRLVAAGGTFIPESYLRPLLDQSLSNPGKDEVFTARQKQVIEAIRRGKPNKIIAYELNMCESTVKVHVRTIMKKLKARNRTQVAYLYTPQAATEAAFAPRLARERN